MTSFFGQSGFGGPPTPSSDTRALRKIDSAKQPFVNKDFVRNIAWLNNSVDVLAGYTELLQKGVDSANQNPIEQLQSFIADIFVMFAGLEPTGIEFGDLKYIFQAIGAMFGINPDTPFPLNLIEAAWHMFSNFIVPVAQFTDIIFDAIIAWAEELGFSDSAIEALQEFDDAVVQLFQDIDDVFGILGDLLKSIFSLFGMGTGTSDSGIFGGLFGEIGDLIQQIISGPRDMLVSVLSLLVTLIFKLLTFLVKMIDPMTWLGATGFNSIGPQLAPEVSGSTVDWSVGSNSTTQWVFDTGESHGGSTGAFVTAGSGTNKRILTQKTTPCTPGDVYTLSAWVWWQSIPADRNTFGPCMVFYSGANEVSQVNIDAEAGHGINGGWTQFSQDLTVPQNVDGMRFGARISNQINTGWVRIDEISCTQNTPGGGGILGGLGGFLGNIPFIGPLIEMFVGSGSGLTGLGGLGSIFSDLLGFIGLGTGSGLGTGNVAIPIVGDIPIIGPLIEAFIEMFVGTGSGITGLSGLGNIFGDLLGLFGLGTGSGLGTGNPILDIVENIPIIGPLIAGLIDMLIGGGSGLFGMDGLGSIFDDLFGLLGGPIGLGTGSPSMLIPNTNLFGLFGPANLGGSIQSLVDSLFQGFNRSSDTGIGLSALSNTASALADQVNWLVLNAAGGTTGTFPPVIEGFTTSDTYDIPTDCAFLDLMVLGGGGGGYGMWLIGIWGDGGEGGDWNHVTLERGVDIPMNTTTLTVTIGNGGNGGSSGSGGNGGTTSISGTGMTTVSATGGAGATSAWADSNGKSPGNLTVNDVVYYGGLEKSSILGSEAGNPPGGGGCGGHWSLQTGGVGGHGGAWVRAY